MLGEVDGDGEARLVGEGDIGDVGLGVGEGDDGLGFAIEFVEGGVDECGDQEAAGVVAGDGEFGECDGAGGGGGEAAVEGEGKGEEHPAGADVEIGAERVRVVAGEGEFGAEDGEAGIVGVGGDGEEFIEVFGGDVELKLALAGAGEDEALGVFVVAEEIEAGVVGEEVDAGGGFVVMERFGDVFEAVDGEGALGADFFGEFGGAVVGTHVGVGDVDVEEFEGWE